MQPPILAHHLNTYLDYARLRTRADNPLLKEAIALTADMDFSKDMIGTALFYKVLGKINEALDQQLSGVQVGKFLNLNALGLIYQISLQAGTLEEGMYYLKNFISNTIGIIDMQLYTKENRQYIGLAINNQETYLNRILLESTLTIIAKELSMMAAEDLDIRIGSPFYNDVYPSTFVQADDYHISFIPGALKAAISNMKHYHLDYLVPQYLMMIEGLKRDQRFINKVKIVALNMATPALPELKDVADGFNMSPRTFQRTLAKEQLTFRQLTDELNKDLAMMLLRHEQYSVSDVGYLLGYAEPAAFQHSFRKWYGETPMTIRKQLLQ
ncbi:helix-turn-helix transcriptional regulator [Chitinophaga sp. Cy-1792]|uniref:helix-turn-helix transcriptional regulator n=1 Tax=Chitinophaga sp. Cy-1792 TaxID=2608339 RepID=UPI001421C99A|nr:helix-turn-helix transcriptional regulator [Chitinophaga sp. Cy-1792]NIG54103.1 helix-turn-helix transcriptional regulator [Chitinophaga sp. Cy-1792]